MTNSNVELLPLPEPNGSYTNPYDADDMTSYTHANLAPLQAEVERLHAENIRLRRTAPPSAPVGVEGLIHDIDWIAWNLIDTDKAARSKHRGVDAIRHVVENLRRKVVALSAQPRPENDHCICEGIGWSNPQGHLPNCPYTAGVSTSTQPQPESTFAKWLATEMPAGTVIGDPVWWANRIASQYAVRSSQPASAPVGVNELIETWRHDIATHGPRAQRPAQFLRELEALAQQPAPVAPPAEAHPVAEIGMSDDGYKIGYLIPLSSHRLPLGTKLYTSPAPSSPVGVEGFVVRHYTDDEGPTIKGNGFDGLRIGEDRDEAEGFIHWVNAALAKQPAAVGVPVDVVREYLDARACYDAATRPPNSHAPTPVLRHGHPDALRLRNARIALDNAVSAAQQPAAVDGAMEGLARKARRLQQAHYGDGIGLHIAMMDWANEFDALAQPQGVSIEFTKGEI